MEETNTLTDTMKQTLQQTIDTLLEEQAQKTGKLAKPKIYRKNKEKTEALKHRKKLEHEKQFLEEKLEMMQQKPIETTLESMRAMTLAETNFEKRMCTLLGKNDIQCLQDLEGKDLLAIKGIGEETLGKIKGKIGELGIEYTCEDETGLMQFTNLAENNFQQKQQEEEKKTLEARIGEIKLELLEMQIDTITSLGKAINAPAEVETEPQQEPSKELEEVTLLLKELQGIEEELNTVSRSLRKEQRIQKHLEAYRKE